MWHSSGGSNRDCRTQPSKDTSTYLHRDVGYGPNAVRAAQNAFINPRRYGHLNPNRGKIVTLKHGGFPVGWLGCTRLPVMACKLRLPLWERYGKSKGNVKVQYMIPFSDHLYIPLQDA